MYVQRFMYIHMGVFYIAVARTQKETILGGLFGIQHVTLCQVCIQCCCICKNNVCESELYHWQLIKVFKVFIIIINQKESVTTGSSNVPMG